MRQLISVIIPTTCEEKRWNLLIRAMRSVLAQEDAAIELIVVINGNQFNDDILKRPEWRDVKIVRLEEGNVSKARHIGLTKSSGQFFCFLDDDDEFLPHALTQRLSLFQPSVDCVVTNGWQHRGQDYLLVPPEVAAHANESPIKSFMKHNWFASPAAMFRKSAIDLKIFDIQHKYFEWTFLFIRLIAAGKILRYHDIVTYRKYEDNPLSVSKSDAYKLANVEFLKEVLSMSLEESLRTEILIKYQSALNVNCQMHLERGERRKAWRAHLHCLKSGGWRYFYFTRKLFLQRKSLGLQD